VLADPSLVSADDFAAALGDPVRLAALHDAMVDGEWREMLAPCGLAGHVKAVRALLRPALRLELERDWSEDEETDDGLVVGESRVGGCPDLPPELPWPEVDLIDECHEDNNTAEIVDGLCHVRVPN
jgi:hypothetical protein